MCTCALLFSHAQSKGGGDRLDGVEAEGEDEILVELIRKQAELKAVVS